MSNLLRVKRWLLDTWKITPPDEWVIACLEWIQEQQEQEGQLESFETQCGQVFDQWLVSDLRDIGSSSFPPDLRRSEKHFLPGIYAAQINSMVDVSQPMYKQIQKLTGMENENALIDAATTQQTQKPQEDWKDKSNRMLMMILTDGMQDVMAIERSVIPTLNQSISLGSKVIIHGGVLCCMGVLFLRPENLSMLGGEVEGLVEQFTPLKIAEDKLRANNESYNPQPGQMTPPGHSLPKKEFLNYTVLSNSDFRSACKGVKPKSSQAPSRGRAFFNDGEPSVKSEPFQSQSAGTPIPPNVKVEKRNSATLQGAVADQFFDDSSDLIFEEAIRQNLGEDRPLTSFNSVISHAVPDVGSGPSAGRGSSAQDDNLRFSDDDDDLVFDEGQVAVQPQSSRPLGIVCRQLQSIRTPVERNDVYGDDDYASMNSFKGASSSYVNVAEGKKRLKLSCNSTDVVASSPMPERPVGMTLAPRDIEDRTGLRPFTYIRHVLMRNACGIYFIKAYVSTVLGKLEHNDGRNWSLGARIDDGSGTLDVVFSDGVLAKLIGFTSSECNDMKRRVKTEPHLKNLILGAIKRCQESLIKLSVIFELQVVPSLTSVLSPTASPAPAITQSFPSPNRDFSYIITNYRRVTQEDVEAMKKVLGRT